MKKIKCRLCNAKLPKDHIALNKKMIGRQVTKFFCLPCLADFLDCSEDDLLVKIEEFKEQGCALFK